MKFPFDIKSLKEAVLRAFEGVPADEQKDWPNDNLSESTYPWSRRPVNELLAYAVAGRTSEEYKKALSALGAKAALYNYSHDNPRKTMEMAGYVERFLPHAPAETVKEYEKIMFDSIVRAYDSTKIAAAKPQFIANMMRFFSVCAKQPGAEAALRSKCSQSCAVRRILNI